MQGQYMSKLSVYLKSYNISSEILLWRLVREQSSEWQRAEIPIQSKNTFKVCNFLGIFLLVSWMAFFYAGDV